MSSKYNNHPSSIEDRKRLFISRSEEAYPELLDYSKLEYINTSSKVTLVCKQHGDFFVTPNHHLQGKLRCPQCMSIAKGKRISKLYQDNFRDLVKKLKDKHKHISVVDYDFSMSLYQKDKSAPIAFSCDIHGNFSKPFRNVLHSNCGCNECGKNSLHLPRERKKLGNNGAINWANLSRDKVLANSRAYTYVLRVEENGNIFYKVGVSGVDSFYFRLKAHERNANIKGIVYISEGSMNECYELEQFILADTQRYTPVKEFVGKTECFKSHNMDCLPIIENKFTKIGKNLNGKKVKQYIGELV